jgi:hypothetical protein
MTRPSDFDPLPDPSPVRVTMGDVIEAGVESWPVIALAWAAGGVTVWATWTGVLFG